MERAEELLRKLAGLPEGSPLDLELSLCDSELLDSFAFYQISSYLIEQGRIASPRELEQCVRLGDLLPFFQDDHQSA
ncbi:MAG: hypothetical protein K6F05_09280 [Succinivibrio sp.]|nr:hypothetical protein [Succinivibrio sp.]